MSRAAVLPPRSGPEAESRETSVADVSGSAKPLGRDPKGARSATPQAYPRRSEAESRENIVSNYLEDFTPGQVFKHWPGRTISEVDNTWFTLLTQMNTNLIHFDAAYAANSAARQMPW